MKNLKQVLALGMAFSLTMSTLASAAFTDQDSISASNADAVELLTTLDVIQGNPDGSFAPDKAVTRAEMAKMIYTIRNGGNDDASAYKSVDTSFTDIAGHWAEGYIKYLQNTNIIAGKSATIFDPDATVTTAEAMKMALVLGGYRADKANLTGAEWFNNTVSLATTNKLTKDVASAMDGGCTRQDAAQILANALGMTAVQWSEFVQGFVNDSDQGLAMSGNKITVGYKWMDLTTYVGRLVSSGDLTISGNAAGNNQFTVAVDTVNDIAAGKYLSDSYYNNITGSYNVTFKDGIDHTDVVGQEVKVLTGDKLDEVFGVYTTGTSKVTETTMDKVEVLSDGKVKVDGTTYDTVDAGVFADLNAKSTVNNVFTSKGQAVSDKVKLIDWENDGDYETVLVNTASVAEITYVSTDSITLGSVGSRDKTLLGDKKVIENTDMTIYEGAAKGDYAVVTKNDYNDKWIIEKAEKIEGTVDGVVKNERKVRVDGTWYTLANTKADGDSDKMYDLLTVLGSRGEFVNKDKITMYVVGDIAYYAESTRGNDVNRPVAMVYDTNMTGGNWNGNEQAKIILPDGTKKTVDIDKVNGNGVTDDGNGKVKELTLGQMYNYTVNNSGEYSFTTLNGTPEDNNSKNNVTAGYDDYVKTDDGIMGTNKYAGYTIADEAIVFAFIHDVDSKTGKHSYDAAVYSGKAVKDTNLSDGKWSSAVGGALTEETNGFTYTRMMNVEITSNDKISNATNYGYLLTDGTYSYNTELGCYVMEYTFWNGSEVVNAVEKTAENKERWATKGETMSYAFDGDFIKDVTNIKASTNPSEKLTYAAMKGVDVKPGYVALLSDNVARDAYPTKEEVLEITSDTTIFYVNSDAATTDKIGVTSSGYNYRVTADKNGDYPVNVAYVKANNGNEVKFMVIDVDGQLKDKGVIDADKSGTPSGGTSTGTSTTLNNPTEAELLRAIQNYDNIKITGELKNAGVSYNLVNADGDPVAVELNDVTVTADTTFTGGSVKLTGTTVIGNGHTLTVDTLDATAGVPVVTTSGTGKLVANNINASGLAVNAAQATKLLGYLQATSGNTVTVGSANFADTAVDIADSKALKVEGKLTLGAMPVLNTSGKLTAGSIEATMTSVSDTELGTLTGYTDDVTVKGVTSAADWTIPAKKTVTVKGDLQLNHNLTVDGTLNVEGQLDLNHETLNGNGTVNGKEIGLGSTISGALTLNFETANIDGNTTISLTTNSGSLNIAGAITTSGDTTYTLDIRGGKVSVTGDVKANVTASSTAVVTTGAVTGNVIVSNTAAVTTGAVTGNVTVSDKANVATGNVTGDVTVSDKANVATGNVTGTFINNSTGNVTEGGTDAGTTVEDILKVAVAYKWSDGYKYTITPTVSGNTVNYSGTHEQFATMVQGVGNKIFATSADMARLLGGIYYTDKNATIVFDGKAYTWDVDGGLTGSNWKNENTTLVSAIAAKIKADFRGSKETDDSTNVKTERIEATYTITINGTDVKLNFVKGAVTTAEATE